MGVARVSETGCNHHAETSGVISRDAAPPGIEFCLGEEHSSLCESWTIKQAEHQRIDAFELWFGEDS